MFLPPSTLLYYCVKCSNIHHCRKFHGSNSKNNSIVCDQHPPMLVDLLPFVGRVTPAALIAAGGCGCDVFISTPGMGIVTPVPNPLSVGLNVGSYVGVRDGMPRPVNSAVSIVGLIVRCMPCPIFSRPKLEEGVGIGEEASPAPEKSIVYVGVGDNSPKSIIPSE